MAKNVPVEWATDARGVRVSVGTTVAYEGRKEAYVEGGGYELNIKHPHLCVSKVAEIYYEPFTGFSYVGNTLVMKFEDGSQVVGDTEIGFPVDIYALAECQTEGND